MDWIAETMGRFGLAVLRIFRYLVGQWTCLSFAYFKCFESLKQKRSHRYIEIIQNRSFY